MKDFDLSHILIFIVPCAFHTALYTHFIRPSNLMQSEAAGATTLRLSHPQISRCLSRGSCWWAVRALIRGVDEKIACEWQAAHIALKAALEEDFSSCHPLGARSAGGYTFGINDAVYSGTTQKRTTGFGFFFSTGRCVFSPLSAAAFRRRNVQ